MKVNCMFVRNGDANSIIIPDFLRNAHLIGSVESKNLVLIKQSSRKYGEKELLWLKIAIRILMGDIFSLKGYMQAHLQ